MNPDTISQYISHKDTFYNKLNILYIKKKKTQKIHCNHKVSGSIRYLHMIGYRSDQVNGALALITTKPGEYHHPCISTIIDG